MKRYFTIGFVTLIVGAVAYYNYTFFAPRWSAQAERDRVREANLRAAQEAMANPQRQRGSERNVRSFRLTRSGDANLVVARASIDPAQLPDLNAVVRNPLLSSYGERGALAGQPRRRGRRNQQREESTPTPTPLPVYHVHGMMLGGARGLAYIEGTLYGEGDIIGGEHVVRIGPEGVVLRDIASGKTRILTIPRTSQDMNSTTMVIEAK